MVDGQAHVNFGNLDAKILLNIRCARRGVELLVAFFGDALADFLFGYVSRDFGELGRNIGNARLGRFGLGELIGHEDALHKGKWEHSAEPWLFLVLNHIDAVLLVVG